MGRTRPQIPMVYMYRMDRAQTATDMAREPSAAGSRSDAGGMERRRSSLSKRLSLRSSLGGGHARHDAVVSTSLRSDLLRGDIDAAGLMSACVMKVRPVVL